LVRIANNRAGCGRCMENALDDTVRGHASLAMAHRRARIDTLRGDGVVLDKAC
jgi:hypothetical protein